ncbi:MAG: BsuBI/PstI family type II restriction endonuclease [Candidatus Nanopelagicales bacterium]|nr:BsuBI/PstI family type II restriction endonuclease [Candidatus Nanopelagicales bacterium]
MTFGPVDELIAQAQTFLNRLGFDSERSNDRSARVLLALLGLRPGLDWPDSTNELRRTVDIMEWIRSHLGVDYKPNTRETIRRQTLHQFAQALLVEQNPDDPTRPVNSPKWCYRICPGALALARAFGEDDFTSQLDQYRINAPSLLEQYAAERLMTRIPVRLPGGGRVTLSPGGQNTLLKAMIEVFCALFTPGGIVLYVGDADAKWAHFDSDAFADLGVTVDSHGKMPDLVVHMPGRDWLVLMEAASSHGPVDAKRLVELKELFAGSTAGLVYVSCFPSRAEMRKYLADIAWETEVWCADDPTHLIHFNGDRFLGPHRS